MIVVVKGLIHLKEFISRLTVRTRGQKILSVLENESGAVNQAVFKDRKIIDALPRPFIMLFKIFRKLFSKQVDVEFYTKSLT